MARPSKIVGHPQRRDMEREYLKGTAVDVIATKFGVPYQPLYRHLNMNKSGLSRQMGKAYELKSNDEGSELLELFTTRIETLIEKLETAIDETETEKDFPTMVSAVKELRQCLESQVKMLLTGKDAGITSENDQLYEKQEADKLFSKRLKRLTYEECYWLEWISTKMSDDPMEQELGKTLTNPTKRKFTKAQCEERKPYDPDAPIVYSDEPEEQMINNAVQDIKPIEKDIVPDVKDKSFKRTKTPLKQDIEPEQDNDIPPRPVIEHEKGAKDIEQLNRESRRRAFKVGR